MKTIQRELNRIAEAYPSIPEISDPNGIFGVRTEAAVKRFQNIFNLAQDGIVGKATWYRIKNVYNGVKRLAELTAENLTFDEVSPIYPSLLKEGMSGDYRKTLQYYLNIISYFDPQIPGIDVDGIFGPKTKAAVIAFQEMFGLSPDGIVGRDTWRVLSKAYETSIKSIPEEYLDRAESVYPGYILSEGISNDDVRRLQTYIDGVSKAYPSIPAVTINGNFDEQTKEAVSAIQRMYGIPVSGVAGPVTWGLIINLYNGIE